MSCTIRSVNDLAQLPDDQLLGCLKALRAAVHREKQAHSALLRAHRTPSGSPFVFESFDWIPRRAQRWDVAQVGPQTPVEELLVRTGAREALKRLHIFCLEDLSAITERELLGEQAIGVKTVARLREMLVRANLDFLEDPDAGFKTASGRA